MDHVQVHQADLREGFTPPATLTQFQGGKDSDQRISAVPVGRNTERRGGCDTGYFYMLE